MISFLIEFNAKNWQIKRIPHRRVNDFVYKGRECKRVTMIADIIIITMMIIIIRSLANLLPFELIELIECVAYGLLRLIIQTIFARNG